MANRGERDAAQKFISGYVEIRATNQSLNSPEIQSVVTSLLQKINLQTELNMIMTQIVGTAASGNVNLERCYVINKISSIREIRDAVINFIKLCKFPKNENFDQQLQRESFGQIETLYLSRKSLEKPSQSSNTIDKETCSLLVPQICSDCIEIPTRTNLSPQPFSRESSQMTNSILTDKEYFHHLSSLLNRYADQPCPYYFRNLNDFQRSQIGGKI
ncbi:unnamed protein product [Adineta ricciae]|uniref:Uncharacterized protein n=1 Tax=Adineta ricciae TaxID=249248 RepID=A0A815L374_ADIRI|nr:unnamed protein product [Adineta ricciae]CAF1652706.1 unnamed protein product [Adineta ricciae]